MNHSKTVCSPSVPADEISIHLISTVYTRVQCPTDQDHTQCTVSQRPGQQTVRDKCYITHGLNILNIVKPSLSEHLSK